MAKRVRKLFGERPERVHVLSEHADFDAEGIATVSDEASEVFAQCPGYELLEEEEASEGNGTPAGEPENGEPAGEPENGEPAGEHESDPEGEPAKEEASEEHKEEAPKKSAPPRKPAPRR